MWGGGVGGGGVGRVTKERKEEWEGGVHHLQKSGKKIKEIFLLVQFQV